MSHFIGLVFVNTNENNLETMLEPYDEQDERFMDFEDRTEEVEAEYDALPDESKDGRDKVHYPDLDNFAEAYFGYEKNLAGRYGYYHNTNAKWDWYAIGNRWDGYLIAKNGINYNQLDFDDVDWEKMFAEDEDGWNRIPFCLVDAHGIWHEKGEMGWFGMSFNAKEADVWEKEVKAYIQQLAELPEEDREAIAVYAVDFHI